MSAERAPIFDDVERTDAALSGYGESTFDFLNRVAGEYWLHPRQLMQTWADQIPDPPDYNDLRQRFRSHDDEQFRSAFLELYLHECLTRAGYRVTIHPSLPATTRRPDFYAERAGAGFYLAGRTRTTPAFSHRRVCPSRSKCHRRCARHPQRPGR